MTTDDVKEFANAQNKTALGGVIVREVITITVVFIPTQRIRILI